MFLLSAAIYPGWSAAAGADVPERHGAGPHGSTAAGSQRNPALVLEEQQIGQADPGLAPWGSAESGTSLKKWGAAGWEGLREGGRSQAVAEDIPLVQKGDEQLYFKC